MLITCETFIFEDVKNIYMDNNIQQKIDNWLKGNYEQSVKDSIVQLQKAGGWTIAVRRAPKL